MVRMVRMSVVLTVLLFVESVLGATYYVRTTGSDLADGMSAETAWKTVGKAVSTMSAGDTVYVGAGTYNQKLTIEADGTSGKPIRYVADVSGAQTGDAGSVILTYSGSDVVSVVGDYIEFEGFLFRGGGNGLNFVKMLGGAVRNCEFDAVGTQGIEVAGATVSISGCNIHDTGTSGLKIEADSTVTIVDTSISGCGQYGLQATAANSTLTLSRVKIQNNTRDGILLDQGTSTVVNCLITRNGGNGILVNNSATVVTIWHTTIAYNGDEGVDLTAGALTIRNSIVAFQGDDGLAERGSSTMNHSYNVVYGNTGQAYLGTSASTGEVSTDPKFAGTADFTLLSGSSALDAGTDGSSVTSVDIDENARPVGDGWDVGCYEGFTIPLFTDVSSALGFDVKTSSSYDRATSPHWGDVDNDGDLDVILTGDYYSRYLRNNNVGTSFTVSTFGGGNIRSQGGLIDMDNDGDLDFWASNVGSYYAAGYFENDGTGAFTSQGDLGMSSPSNNEGHTNADVNHDGWLDVVMFSGNGNWIGHHQGAPSGSLPALVATNDVSYGLNDSGDYGDGEFCSAGDVNNDGYTDFFYHYGNGKLFLSDGDGTYTENLSGIAVPSSNSKKLGSEWVDYDNDGDLDLFAAGYDTGQKAYLWRNDNGTFTDVGSSAGLSDTSGQRSGCWGDYDNDGDLDLYLVARTDVSKIYQNQGNGTFINVGEGADISGKGHDCAWVDYDNDGDLDLSLTRESTSAVLLKNGTDDQKYLKVRVVGGGNGVTNVGGVGVRVELYSANGATFLGRREIGVARGYGGSKQNWVHFGGVDPNTSYQVRIYLDSLAVNSPLVTTVTPGSVATVINGVTIPQMLTIVESSQLVLKTFGTGRGANRRTRMQTVRNMPGWVAPQRDLDHLKTLDQN